MFVCASEKEDMGPEGSQRGSQACFGFYLYIHSWATLQGCLGLTGNVSTDFKVTKENIYIQNH